ncbi:MAG: STAS domain-containing protein [Planctomycetota bacterium]|nr:STAS domain-containing protein [Planctomycetota bacterium]
MKIERKTTGNVTILAFAGTLDTFNLPTASEKIDALIQTSGTRLVFNLRRLRRVNSLWLGFMIQTQRRLREFGGELVLSEPSKFFHTAIKTVGMDQIRVCVDDDDAVKYFEDVGGRHLLRRGDEDDGTAGAPARLRPHRSSGSGEASPPQEEDIA